MSSFQEQKERQLIEQEKITSQKPEHDLTKESSAETQDPYDLKLDLKENRFYIGGYEIHRDMMIEDIRKQVFFENAKEVQDLKNPDGLHVILRHTAKFAGEEWVVILMFEKGYFKNLWLEHAKVFTQKSLLKNAASSPRLRKERSTLYTKLKKRLDELTESKGYQVPNRGNIHYIYDLEGHSAGLVQDNNMPAIVILVKYLD